MKNKICIVGGARMTYTNHAAIVACVSVGESSIHSYKEIENKAKLVDKHTKNFFRGFKYHIKSSKLSI